jgi:ribosomal protein S17
MSKKTKSIRKELAILIEGKLKLCTSKKEKNAAVEIARQEINKKYGKGWRQEHKFKPSKQYDYPSIYDGHTFGEYWME